MQAVPPFPRGSSLLVAHPAPTKNLWFETLYLPFYLGAKYPLERLLRDTHKLLFGPLRGMQLKQKHSIAGIPGLHPGSVAPEWIPNRGGEPVASAIGSGVRCSDPRGLIPKSIVAYFNVR